MRRKKPGDSTLCSQTVFLLGDVVPYIYPSRTSSLLGTVVEEVANGLAECFCTVLRSCSAAVIILAPVCA